MRCFALLLALALAGCATSSAFRAGEKAERRQNYDQAVLEYSKALKENPDNPHYRKSLERARLRASEEHARAVQEVQERLHAVPGGVADRSRLRQGHVRAAALAVRRPRAQPPRRH